ncbi:FecR domain-containing protein [Rubritalea tangerina]
MILEGPAHYTITGDNHGQLAYGKFVAKVPKGAEGFTVDYPNGKVVDLGTEFGVQLDRNGDLSVGVFEGEVELHPQGRKDIALIEKNHALAQSADNPQELSSIPFERDQFVRHIPSREFSWNISTPGEIEKSFDISHLIWKPGEYRALVKWMSGHKAVMSGRSPIKIKQATLWHDKRLISSDVHDGFTGHVRQTRDNIYHLHIPDEDFSKGKWILKVRMQFTTPFKNTSKNTSKGVLLLEEGTAYAGKDSDFIGRWQYTHDGVTWIREFHPDGSVSQFANGGEALGFRNCHWKTENGVLKLWLEKPHYYTDHILRDPNTLIFVDQPFRHAVKIKP